MRLSAMDRRRVAVVVDLLGTQQVVRGVGRYELDSTLGKVLRIDLSMEHPEQGSTSFIIQESSWDGEFTKDSEYGCDFLVHLGSAVSVGW